MASMRGVKHGPPGSVKTSCSEFCLTTLGRLCYVVHMKTLFKLAVLGFMVATCSTMWHRANSIIETQPPQPIIVTSDPPVDDATFSCLDTASGWDLQATFSAPNPAPTAQPITVQQVTNVSVNVQQSPVW